LAGFCGAVLGITAVLLGSGAEHLDGGTKRTLATMLLKAASLLADHWTRRHRAVDFDELKRDLTKDENLNAIIEAGDAPPDKEKLKKLIINVADVLEYWFVAEPFRQLIHHLCERARHRVLGISVQNAAVSEDIEKLMHGVWLTDIDSKRGQRILRDAIRDLPTAPFLRVTLATPFMTRVYWNHWKKEDRLTLLEAAEEALKPLALSLNKPRLQRLISRSKPESSPGVRLND
jgi:hypothetical protein